MTSWRLFPDAVEIPEKDPFAHDRLGRKAEAQQLTILLKHSPTPLVLGLDAAWGTGKTTFVKMWQRQLENEGYKTIYFNAWETDFTSEPLVALVGEIGRLLPQRSKATKKLTSATVMLLKKATPIAIRLLTAGLIDIKAEDINALTSEDIDKAFSETAEKIIEGAIEQHHHHQNEVVEFRKALSQAVVATATDGKPLVFFIDELDRCRPTFAVELLERIKHLFEVSGVVFVLSVHREQLAHSIKAIYGHDFDAEGYLGRFFQLSYRLADPRPGDYAKFLVEQVGFTSYQPLSESLSFLMGYLGFSLRQQQRCVARMALMLRIIGQGNGRDEPATYTALIAFREFSPKLYDLFLKGEKTADDLIEKMVAVNHLRWVSHDEAKRIEVGLLKLELDRQIEINRELRGSSWYSSRLQYHQAQSGSNERSKRIVDEIEGYVNESRHYRASPWRRVISILELGQSFKIDEQN